MNTVYSKQSTALEKSPTSIHTDVSELCEAIESINKPIEELEGLLGRLMRPEPPASPSRDGIPISTTVRSEIGERLGNQILAANRISSRIQHIIRRLDV